MSNEQLAAISGFVTILLQIVIDSAVPVFVGLVVMWGLKRIKLIEANLTANEIQQFKGMVETVVMAAEKSGLSGIIGTAGAAKKKWAIDALQAIVDAHGWKIPVAQIEAEIEQAIALGLHRGVDSSQLESAMGFSLPETEPDDDEDDVTPTPTSPVAPADPTPVAAPDPTPAPTTPTSQLGFNQPR